MGVEFRVLGPVEVVREAGRVVGIGAKARLVLAVLLVHANEVVSLDALIGALWGDDAPATAEHLVQNHVSQLRKVVEADRGVPRLILRAGPGYRLVAGASQVDAARFEQQLSGGRSALAGGRPDQAADILTEALALWRGPSFAEFADEDSIRPEAQRLDHLRLLAVEERIEADIGLGRHGELVAELQQLVAEHPFDERLCGQLMRCLYRSGRHADALAAFSRLREQLNEELGLVPSPELVALEHAILVHDPALAQNPAWPSAPLKGRGWRAPAAPRPTHGWAPVTTTPSQLLSRPQTALVGRASDVERLVGILAGTRLVTLVGVGGVGKTRLAGAVAELAGKTRADGIVVCELATIGRDSAVAAALATMLAVQPQTGRPIASSVADALSSRQMLLVLDNCEHVLDGVAELAIEIEARCPDVTVLATSREPLRVPGEQLWPVQPLTEADGVELFLRRASGVHPDVPLTDETEVLGQLCQRLDGLPLAIELAAACVGSLTVHDLLEGLEDRFTLLGRAERRGTARHRTLAAMVGWSHQMLTDDERALFDRLSVFRGRFDLDAATAVAAAGSSQAIVRALLTALVDKSMVNVDLTGPHTRYWLLDTMREYGLAELVAGDELHEARRRHLAYFLDLAQRARQEYVGYSTGDGHATFVAEWDNFRAALQWAVAQRDVESANRMLRALFCFAWYNLRHELGRWAENVLELGTVDPTTAGIAAAFRCKQLDTDRAIALARLGLDAAERPTGDGVGLCSFALADAHWTSGQAARGWAIARESSDAVDDDGDSAIVTSAIAEAAYIGAMYDPPASQPYIERLRLLSRRIDDPGAEYCCELAESIRALGERDYDAAELHLYRASEIADAMACPLHIGVARQVRAGWALRTHRDDTDEILTETLAFLHNVQDSGAWSILEALAIRWVNVGRLQDGAVVLGYLDRHGINHAVNVQPRAPASARVVASPECAEALRHGAMLSRDGVFEFALTAIRQRGSSASAV